MEELSGHGEGSVNSVAWHPRNERMFASCSDDHTVRIWESPILPTVGRDRVGGRLSFGEGGVTGFGAESRNGLSNGTDGVGVSNGKGKGVVRQSWGGPGAGGMGNGNGSGVIDEVMNGEGGTSTGR